MRFEIKAKGVNDVIRTFAGYPNQVRFAMAQAANDTAKDVQAKTLAGLPRKFTLRSRGAPWWKPGTRMGFNIQFANKQTLTSTIGSRADWLDLQERGGTKSVSGKSLAVPTGVRETPSSVIPRAMKVRRLLASKRAFVIKTSRGAYTFERTGKGPRELKLLYTFKNQVPVPPRLAFFAEGKPVVESKFPVHFRARLVAAIASAR